MSEVKHTPYTPGPWANWDSPSMSGLGVTGPTAAAAMLATNRITESGYAKWVEVLTLKQSVTAIAIGLTQEEAHANARLIAAAPCLLSTQTMGVEVNTPDFLDWIADRLVHVHAENPNADFVLSLRERAKAGRAAIARATGVQQ